MILKVLSVMLIILMFAFSFAFVLENLDIEPVELKKNYLEPETLEFVDYGAVPVFSENLRFNHNLISYSIGASCDEERRSDMVAAFNIFSDEVKVVSFYETDLDGDIKVLCSNEYVGLGKELFAAGEGGPSRIVNTSGFRVIEEGKVTLYNSEDCGYPIVALHELLHVFGFDHSRDPNNIMFNVSACDQRMSEDMISLMVDLYSVEALADLKIGSVDAVIHGRYLDFNVSVLNEGLVGVKKTDLAVFVDGREVDVFDLGEIEIGYGRTLKIENMRIGIGAEEVRFVVDEDDLVRELSEENNEVLMRA